MKTIWKITMGVGYGPWDHQLPKDAVFLDVQMQNGMVAMWFAVDPEAEKEQRRFTIYGTGREIKESWLTLAHLGTVKDGQFVWHLFEKDD